MTSAIQNPGILIRIFPPAAAADRQNPLMVDAIIRAGPECDLIILF